MAKSGRFGRMPRRAPDLSGSIAAMMSQYWSTVETNMVDAWKEGGEVDGKVVTDERMIQFWKDRRNSVSKDDPLWDHYDNLIGQYDFAIRESEVGLKYAQHKMSAGAVARWYRGEAGNYARNSEMYRTVMGQAARFMDAARAGAASSKTERRTKAYNSKAQEIYDHKVAPFLLIQNGLDALTRAYTAQGPMNTAFDEKGDQGASVYDLTYSMGGPNVWEFAYDAASDPTHPLHAWWVENVVKPAEALGVTIDADTFTQDNIKQAAQTAIAGREDLTGLAKRYKDIVDVDAVTAENTAAIHFIENSTEFTATFDEESKYATYRSQLDRVRNDADSTPEQIVDAFQNYFRQLVTLEQEPDVQANGVFVASLQAERRGILGDPSGWGRTIAEGARNTPFGTEGARDPVNEGDIDVLSMSSQYQNAMTMAMQVRAGTHVRVVDDQGNWQNVAIAELPSIYGSNYAVIPTQIAPLRTLTPSTDQNTRQQGLTDATGSAEWQPAVTGAMVVPTVPLVVQAYPANAYDPDTGDILADLLPADRSTSLGVVALLPNGRTVYGIKTANGIRYTAEPPFLDGAVVSTGIEGQGANTAFVVTANPSFPNLVSPEGEDKVDTFRPRNMIDGSIVGSESSFAFGNIALADMTRDPGSRFKVAKMGAEDIMTIVTKSPEIDVTNDQQMNQLWTDVNLVRQVAALDEWAARREISAARTDPNLWADTPPPTYTDIRASATPDIMNSILGSIGLNPVGTKSAITPTGLGLANADAQASVKSYFASKFLGGISGTASVGSKTGTAPTGPGLPGSVSPDTGAPVWAPPPGSTVPWGGMGGYDPTQKGTVYGQPQIQVAGQVTLPSLPPSMGPNPTGVAPTPPTVTPRPITTPKPPTAPTPPVWTPPNAPWMGDPDNPLAPCFTEDTLIATPTGPKAISLIEIGEQVLSFDHQMGDFKIGKVTQVFHHLKDMRPRVKVRLEGGTEVTATTNHPFWAPDSEKFMPIGEMAAGDFVFTVAGGWEKIVAIEPTEGGPADVFNLTVKGFNTYVANGIAVHNKT